MMMKRLLPAILTLLGAYSVSAQVGIGTSNPSPSAQLQIVSQDRGVLIPQVQLTSTTDTTTITAGNVQSLLVYNISTSADIKPGYYYWYINKWYRLINDADLAAGGQPGGVSPIVDNGDGTYTYVNPDGTTTTIDVPGHQTLTFLVYNPTAKTLTYTAENGLNTVIDINAMVKNSETVTTLVDNNNGTITYTNEAGVATIITKAQGVQGAQGVGIASTVNNGNGTFTITYTDGTTFTTANFTGPQGPAGTDGVIGSNGADGLSAYQIWLNAGNTGTEAQFLASLQGAQGPAGANGTMGVDGLSAYQIWLNAGNTGTEAQFLASLQGAQGPAGPAGVQGTDGRGITTTINNGDGTFTINYTDGTSTTIDFKNIETTTNIVNNGDGTYTYTNEDGIQTVIDVRANAVPFNNTASGINATTVQGAIDALAAANTATNTQLNAITLVEENDGKVTLVKADGSKVKVDKANITDNGDGTYTFTNNDGTDVTINSNNLVITENAGIYIFADAAGSVLGSINTNASALGYNNTASGLNATTVQGAIDEVNNNISTQINTVALVDNQNGTVSLIGANGVNLGTVSKATLSYNVATGKYTFTNNDGSDVTLGGEDLTAGDNSVEVAGGTHALLAPANVKVKDGGITEAKLADEAVTSVKIKDGEVKNADLADDAVSTDKILNGTIVGEDIANETITNNKLDAGSAATGTVATSNGDGTVSYLPVSTANLAGKEDLTAADGAAATIEVIGGTDAVLAAASLRVKNESITSLQIKNGEVKNADLSDDAVSTDKILNGTILGEDIAAKTITPNKLTANNGAADRIAIADATGTVTFSNAIPSGSIAGKAISSTDLDVSVDGATAVLKDVTINIKDGAVTETKLGTGAVTTTKLGADAVTNDKLADNAVQTENIKDGEVKLADLDVNSVDSSKIVDDSVDTADLKDGAVTTSKILDGNVTATKLIADTAGADENKVATAHANGTVTYENVSTANLADKKDLTAGDGSITVTDGLGATLANTNVKVADLGITTAKLGADAVTNDKLADNAVQTENIKDGEVKLADLDVNSVDSSKIVDGSVETADLKDGAVTTAKILDGNVTATKLIADTAGADENKVATAHANGTVTYENVSTVNLADKKDLTAGDGSITVTDGLGATLANTNIKVADLGITTAKLGADAVTNDKLADNAVQTENIKDGEVKLADLDVNSVDSSKIVDGSVETADLKDKAVTDIKLNSGSALTGQVATANGAGGVTYTNLSTANLADKKDLTAGDGSITVTDGLGATLANTNVKVADLGITTAKLGADAVTNDKLADNAVQTENIKDGEVKLADLDVNSVDSSKIVDGSVETADLKDKAVTDIKLNSGSALTGQVATANGAGGVTYTNLSTANLADKKDLTAGDGSITVTDGLGATLANTNVKVADLGITTAKLGADAVTNDKLADNAVQTENIKDGEVKLADLDVNSVDSSKIVDGSVETADLKDKAVTDIKLNSGSALTGQVATANGAGGVTYTNLSTANLADKKDLTAGDGSITVTDGLGATLANTNVKVADLGITTAKLGADAVTNDKLADNAVQTENIADNAVTTVKINDGAVTSSKIDSGVAGAGLVKNTSNGKLDIANNGVTSSMINADVAGDGLVKNTTTGKLDVVAGAVTGGKALLSNDLDVTSPEGATALLKEVTVNIKNNAITSAKIANGTILTEDIASGGTEKVLTTATDGTVTWVDKTELAIEPWNNQNTSNKATANGSNIYQNGSIGIGNFAAENVSEKLDVKDGNVKIRQINTVEGVPTDKMVVADSNGVLKTVTANSIVKKTTSYSAIVSDETILADATLGDMTITLPVAAAIGKKYNIKKVDGTDFKVTISGNGKNIDGIGSISGALPHQGWVLQYDGTEWYIINRI